MMRSLILAGTALALTAGAASAQAVYYAGPGYVAPAYSGYYVAPPVVIAPPPLYVPPPAVVPGYYAPPPAAYTVTAPAYGYGAETIIYDTGW